MLGHAAPLWCMALVASCLVFAPLASSDSLEVNECVLSPEQATDRAALDLERSILGKERSELAAAWAALNAERASLAAEQLAAKTRSAPAVGGEPPATEPLNARCFDGNLTFWSCCLADGFGKPRASCGLPDECCVDRPGEQSKPRRLPIWYEDQVSCWGQALGPRFDFVQQSLCCATAMLPEDYTASCNVDACFARCEAQYGGTVTPGVAGGLAYMCAKGCARMGGGEIQNINHFCDIDAQDREASCLELHSGSPWAQCSSQDASIDACVFGCAFWALTASTTPTAQGTSVDAAGCFSEQFSQERCCASSNRKRTRRLFRQGTLPDEGSFPNTVCTGNRHHLACEWKGRPQGLILYCGQRLAGFLYDLVATVSALHFSLVAHEEPGSGEEAMAKCGEFFDEEVNKADPNKFPAIALLSPLLTEFDVVSDGHALDALARHLREHLQLGVFGLPTVVNDSWEWPIFEIRHAYWKLAYSQYPTGYSSWVTDSEDLANCFGGDSTSATRVYNSSFLRSLLDDQPLSELGSSWLVHLDLRARQREVPAFTCLTPWAALLREGSYLRSAELTPALSRYHDVEAAKFHADSAVQLHCVGARTSEEGIEANKQGLVTSYCYRLALREALQELDLAWTEVAKGGRIAIPVLGTAIAIFRNGILPWDYDADVILTSGGRLSVKKLRNRLEEADFEVELSDVKSTLTSADEQHWVLQRKSFGSIAEVDAWIHLSPSLTDAVLPKYAVNVSGFQMSVSRTLLTRMTTKIRNGAYVATNARLFGLAAKLDKNHKMLRCKRPGHTACLPAFQERNGITHGEFQDNFVHLDSWP